MKRLEGNLLRVARLADLQSLCHGDSWPQRQPVRVVAWYGMLSQPRRAYACGNMGTRIFRCDRACGWLQFTQPVSQQQTYERQRKGVAVMSMAHVRTSRCKGPMHAR